MEFHSGGKRELEVQTDAAGMIGYGMYYRGKWCTGKWPDEWHTFKATRDLIFLELFPIAGALWPWANDWANSVATFWCDNQTVVHGS